MKPSGSFSTDRSKAVPLLHFFSFLFVRRWFHIWRLFCHYLFLISPSFGASGRLSFVGLSFPGYLYLYF